jgi:predicted phosphodiesterase
MGATTLPSPRVMKYAILGDIHSNIEAFQAVLEKTAELDVDAYVCIGDIVGYNASPNECLELLESISPEIIVRGNHDEYVATNADLIGFNPQAAHVVSWTRGQLSDEKRKWLGGLPYEQTLDTRTTIVHATLDMPGRWGYVFDRLSAAASFNYQFTPVCFFGHTHVPCIFDKFGAVDTRDPSEIKLEQGHKYMINPGSVGQPRDGDPRASFAVYDADERTVGFHRVDYDLAACQKRIRDCQLPERSADRLAAGR